MYHGQSAYKPSFQRGQHKKRKGEKKVKHQKRGLILDTVSVSGFNLMKWMVSSCKFWAVWHWVMESSGNKKMIW